MTAFASVTRNKPVSRQLYEQLVSQIARGDYAAGQRLPSIARIAREIGTSQMPVVQAFDRLADEGYVVKRRGSGTVVCERPEGISVSRSVALCMQTEGHLFSRLHHLLVQHLQRDGVSTIPVCTGHAANAQAVRRAVHSDVAALLVHASASFPLQQLRATSRSAGRVIACVNWESSWRPAGLRGVLIDFRAAAQRVARALRGAGHRRVVIVGTTNQTGAFRKATPPPWCMAGTLREELDRLGVSWTLLDIDSSATAGEVVRLDDRVSVPYVYDEARLLAALEPDAAPPDAVVSLMDVHVWYIQKMLRERRPELLDRLPFFSYGNTPWRRFAERDFVSVDYDLPSLARRLAHHVDCAVAGDDSSAELEYVAPRLAGVDPL